MLFNVSTVQLDNTTNGTGDLGADYENENTTHPEVSFRYVGIAIGIIDIVLGTLGNILTILAFAKSRKLRRNAFNHFIVNLAVIDFLTASWMMPFNVAGYIYMEWPFGNNHVTCAFQAFFYFCCGYTSVMCFLAITLNRFIGIVFPERYVTVYSKKWERMIMFSSWLIAPAFLLPPLIVSIKNNLEGHPGMPTGWKERQFLCSYVNIGGWGGYMQLVRVVFQFLPLVLMILAYVIIWYRVHASNKRLNQHVSLRQYMDNTDTAKLDKTLQTRDSPQASLILARGGSSELRKYVHKKNAETNGGTKAVHENGTKIGHAPNPDGAVDALATDNSPDGSSSSVDTRDCFGGADAIYVRMQREKRLIYVSIIIWVTFTVLFLPSLIINLLPNRANFSPVVHMAASNITWFNSCLNPIIYVAAHKRMRHEYGKIIKSLLAGIFTSNGSP